MSGYRQGTVVGFGTKICISIRDTFARLLAKFRIDIVPGEWYVLAHKGQI